MKRIISLILVIIAVLVSFSACSKTEKAETDQRELKITVDSTYNFDSSVVSAYETLCKAVLAGEDFARINASMFSDVMTLYNTSFPLNAVVESVNINGDGSGVNIKYKANSKYNIENFRNMIFEIYDECSKGATTNGAYIAKVYSYIAGNINPKSDYSTTFDAVINSCGNASAYAGLFEYLLLQKGIDAYHIVCTDAASNPWGISASVINGEIYYFDLFSEFEENGGKLLHYFGMTTQDVYNEGLSNLSLTNKMPPADSSDLAFEPCRYCELWEIDGNKLLVTKYDGVVVEVAL